MKKAIVLILAVSLLGVGALQAADVETPIPGNAYITQNGLDWAWAAPWAAPDNGFDISYQSQFGWRLPTELELQSAPLATDFMFPGANVPLGGTDPISGARFQATNAELTGAAACATPYFSTHDWCDWRDGNGQPNEPWAGLPGDRSWSDQLVVRAETEVVIEYKPVPSLGQFSMILLILLAGTLGLLSLRRMQNQ